MMNCIVTGGAAAAAPASAPKVEEKKVEEVRTVSDMQPWGGLCHAVVLSLIVCAGV